MARRTTIKFHSITVGEPPMNDPKKTKSPLPETMPATDPKVVLETASQSSTQPASSGLANAGLGTLGGYRIVELLGQGGMGAVYAAEDTALKRAVAIKTLKGNHSDSADARTRFVREAQAAAAIESDHIVRIYHVGEDNGVPFIAMEFLRGKPLDEWMAANPSPSLSQILKIGIETATGLAAAHAKSLVHRDIKPSNLWIEAPHNRVKILDFGLARSASDAGLLTGSGVILGTPAYMAPEQARAQPVDFRCDLFSLGCVLYHLATGRRPFTGADTMSILTSLALDTPPPPHEVNAKIPVAFSDLVGRLLSKKPDDRPSSAESIAEDLRQIQSGLEKSAAPVDPAPANPSARNRRLGLAALSIIAMVCAGLLYFLPHGGTTPNDVELVSIPISQYRHITWGANPTADRDADELHQPFSQAGGSRAHMHPRNALEQLSARDPQAPVLVFISALAIVRDGRVVILPGDAGIDKPESWLPLTDVLAAVAACPASNKALLLDIAHSPADPFHGPLQGIAAQLDKQLGEYPLRFPVLCSCSPGERSLVIPELGLTAFAACLSEGLQGEADGYSSSEQTDDRISFEELSNFTIARVSQLAAGVFDARQMPKRYGPDGSEFVLRRGRTRKPAQEQPTEPPPAVPAYPVELLDAWKTRDQAIRDERLIFAPDIVLELEAALLRAEEQYLLGIGTNDPRLDPSWKVKLNRLRERTRILELPGTLRGVLTGLRAGRKEPHPQLRVAIDRWMRLRFPQLDETGKPVPVNPAELEKVGQDMDNLLQQDDQMLDGLWHFWTSVLYDPQPTRDKIMRVSTILDERFHKLPLTSEQMLLRRLAKMPSGSTPDSVRALIQSEQFLSEALSAMAGRLPEGFNCVQKILTAGNALKVEGESLMFAPRATVSEIEAARSKLIEAAAQLKLARDGALLVRSAHREWIEAAGKLHACLPGMVASNRPSLENWLAAADQTMKVSEQTERMVSADAGELGALEGLRRKLGSSAAGLVLAGPAQIKKLVEDARQRPEASLSLQLKHLLSGAFLAAEERAALAHGVRVISAQRYHAVRAKFDREVIRAPVQVAMPEDPLLATRRRTAASIELLRLAGHRDVEKFTVASRRPLDDASAWQSLGEQLRVAWTREVPESAARDAAAGKWPALERIIRASPAGIAGIDPQGGFDARVQTEEIQRRKWLAARFMEYGKLRRDVPGAVAFYTELAEECDRPLPKLK